MQLFECYLTTKFTDKSSDSKIFLFLLRFLLVCPFLVLTAFNSAIIVIKLFITIIAAWISWLTFIWPKSQLIYSYITITMIFFLSSASFKNTMQQVHLVISTKSTIARRRLLIDFNIFMRPLPFRLLRKIKYWLSVSIAPHLSACILIAIHYMSRTR